MSVETENRINEGLLNLIKQGDKESFRILYLEFYKKLYAFLYLRSRSEELSKDIIQTIFMKLWINRSKIDPQKSIKAYLYTAASNALINQWSLSSSKNESLENFEGKISEDNINYLNYKIDLDTALRKLSEKEKSVFLLNRYDGYKYAEIAEICGISIKAVEKRMTNAIKKIKKYIDIK